MAREENLTFEPAFHLLLILLVVKVPKLDRLSIHAQQEATRHKILLQAELLDFSTERANPDR